MTTSTFRFQSITAKRFALLALLCASLAPICGCGETRISQASTPVPLPPIPNDDDVLRERIDKAYALTGRRHLVAETNAAWQVVHGILAFGPDLMLDVQGKPVSALKYLQGGGRLNGWVLIPGDKGLEAPLEAGSKSGQGHEDQWLGYLSLIGLPGTTPLKVGDRTFTVQDLMTQAMWDIYPGMESTWTLMGLTAYQPEDVKWKSKDGSDWTIERVVQMEATQDPSLDLRNSACGGTHRLVGLTVALQRHLKNGGKLERGWKSGQDRIDTAVQMMKEYQQPDGSFSSDYLRRPNGTADIGNRIGTTGHTLEFLVLALPNDYELRSPWVTEAVLRLCDMLEQTREYDLECGGLYHAARGLRLYRERRFGSPPPSPEAQAETKPAAAG